MNKHLDLRLKAFRRSLETLDVTEIAAIWRDQQPVVFTRLHMEAGLMVAALEEAGKKQLMGTRGVASEKEIEETELETAAHTLAQALRVWFSHTRQETEAVEMTLPVSAWQQLRDQQLLQKSQRVIDLATAVASGPDAARAGEYGITGDAVKSLIKEREDYDAIVNAPGVVAAVRKALTKGMTQAFALVETKFGEMDSIILQFAGTPEGREMILAWKNARIQKGQRSRHSSEEPQPASSGIPQP